MSKKKKSRATRGHIKDRYQRSDYAPRRSLLDKESVFKYDVVDVLRRKRKRERLYDRYVGERVRKELGRLDKWRKDWRRHEKEALVRRVTPGSVAFAMEVRNFIEDRKKWICTKRRSRRESMFGSGAVGKNIIVSKLRKYTIDSLVDCRRS